MSLRIPAQTQQREVHPYGHPLKVVKIVDAPAKIYEVFGQIEGVLDVWQTESCSLINDCEIPGTEIVYERAQHTIEKIRDTFRLFALIKEESLKRISPCIYLVCLDSLEEIQGLCVLTGSSKSRESDQNLEMEYLVTRPIHICNPNLEQENRIAGIGKRLLRESELVAREYPHIRQLTATAFRSAYSFYCQEGFEVTGEFPKDPNGNVRIHKNI